MSTVDFNRSVLISFVVPFDPAAIWSEFKSVDLPVESFLNSVATVKVPAATEIMVDRVVKASMEKSLLKMSLSQRNENLAIRELKTEPTRQDLRASLTTHTYAMKNGRN